MFIKLVRPKAIGPTREPTLRYFSLGLSGNISTPGFVDNYDFRIIVRRNKLWFLVVPDWLMNIPEIKNSIKKAVLWRLFTLTATIPEKPLEMA